MSELMVVPLVDALDFREGPGIMAIDFHKSGVPLIRLAGLKPGADLLSGCNYLDPDKVEAKWKHFRVEEGDVLLSTSASLGEVAVVDAHGVGAVPYTGIIRFRPKDDTVAQEFIQYALRSPGFRQQIVEMGVGSVMNHFGPTHLKQMTLSLPTLDQQRGIAEVLGALDDKIAANAQLVSVADQLASALTRRSLSDSDVVLTDIADITMGSSPPGSSYNAVGDGLVFYQGVRDFGVRVPSNRVWTTEPVRLADVHDTLVSVRAPVGRTNLASERICIGRGLAAVRSTTGHPFTLFHILRDSPDAWAPYEAEGTVFGSINKHQLAGLRVGVAGAGQADRLEQELASMEGRILAALTESDSLAKTRDALLPQLMSGQITVKDAECVVEGAM